MQPVHNENHLVIITNSTIGNCSITDPPSQCVSSNTLQILNTRVVDSREYTCVATNEAGSDAMTASLIVNGKIFCIITLKCIKFVCYRLYSNM